MRNLGPRCVRVLRERAGDAMSVQKYDIQRPAAEGGGFEERFWSPYNSPVLRSDGSLAYIIHRVEDITEYVQLPEGHHLERRSTSTPMEAEIVLRAREVADSGRQLKESNAELATLYARSQEMDRIKTNFFANVSHELRTPLALILAPAERVLAELAPDDPHRRDLEVVLRNARTLLGHVNDLLDASKLEASKLDLEYSTVDLAHLVRLTANNFETLAVDREVEFQILAPPAVPAQVDPSRLQQVLLNLLSNAFKFTPADGRVRIELTRRGVRGDEVATLPISRWPTAGRASRPTIGTRSSNASIDSTASRTRPGAAPASASTSPVSWCSCTAVLSVSTTRPRVGRSSWSSCRWRPLRAPPCGPSGQMAPAPVPMPAGERVPPSVPGSAPASASAAADGDGGDAATTATTATSTAPSSSSSRTTST